MIQKAKCKGCGSSNIVTTQDGENFSVACKICLNSGRAKDSEEKAITDWNELNK